MAKQALELSATNIFGVDVETLEMENELLAEYLKDKDKIDHITALAKLARQAENNALTIKAQIEPLIKKAKKYEEYADMLKEHIKTIMTDNGINKAGDIVIKVTLNNSPSSLVVIDEESVPDEFFKIRRELDKSAIKRHIDANGDVDFAFLKQSKHVRIS